MEPISSLINKLQIQSNEGASNTQLLITVELLRNALTQSCPLHENHTGVAVWLPNGFKQNPISISKPIESTGQIEEEKSPIPAPVFARAPQPPTNITEPQLQTEEILKSIGPLLASLNQNIGEIKPIQEQIVPIAKPELFEKNEQPVEKPAEIDLEKPIVFELQLEADVQEAEMVVPAIEAPELQVEAEQEPEKTVVGLPSFFKKINPLQGLNVVTQPQPKPMEINELVASETTVLNETLGNKAPILADVLIQTNISKVADLRKALSINEKYQFINLLFRGDDAMFERSLRTLNNFNILAEANYWMQRELVVKMGWNDTDELVQQFYKLVSRRYS